MESTLILYPRSYNLRGYPSYHSVLGMSSKGEIVNVKLRLDPEQQASPNAPSIAEFARTDFKARTPCIAHEDNCPENREGILLFSNVSLDRSHRGQYPTYTARWAVVLAEHAESPDPFFGIGRMSISRNTRELERITAAIETAKLRNEDASSLEASLNDGSLYTFSAILYHFENMARLTLDDQESFINVVSSIAEKYCVSGIMGGVLLRPIDGFMRRIATRCIERFVKFSVSSKRIQSGHEFATRLVSTLNAWRADGFTSVEVIPISRVGCGPKGKRHYGNPSRLKHLERMFLSKTGEPMLCNIALRITYFEDDNTTLLSRIYALGPPLGSPLELEMAGNSLKSNPVVVSHHPSLLPVPRLELASELGRTWWQMQDTGGDTNRIDSNTTAPGTGAADFDSKTAAVEPVTEKAQKKPDGFSGDTHESQKAKPPRGSMIKHLIKSR